VRPHFLLLSFPLAPFPPPSASNAPCSPLVPPTANRKELVTDFLRKAKQLEFLIEALPSLAAGGEGDAASGTKEDEEEFEQLEREMKKVNEEYEVALGEAGALSFSFLRSSSLRTFLFPPFSTDPPPPTETLHRQLEISLRGILETRSNPAAVAA